MIVTISIGELTRNYEYKEDTDYNAVIADMIETLDQVTDEVNKDAGEENLI